MVPFKFLASVVGAAFACVALLLACAVATAGAVEPCASSAMYIAAHEDDTLLFQSPSVLQDIQSERCVRTVFVTAGDAGRSQSYWSTREDGAESAYAQMAGVANQWTGSQILANGYSIHLETLKARPDVSIVYMRLPDGGVSGGGFPLYGSQSLAKLWKGGNPGSGGPTISSITAVDNSNTYSYQGLIDTLADLIESFEPQQIVTQNYTEVFAGPDHPDHVGTAYFTQEAQELYGEPHRLAAFEDYETSSRPQNVFGELLGAKQFAFYAYGAHDSDACASEGSCSGTSYSKWLTRQYIADTETVGVVAHAGYTQQTAAPSSTVTLDGSQSSDESGKALKYAWTQTGGPAVSLSGATTSSPSFVTPSHPTLLTFSLTVKDGSTSSQPDLVKIRVPSSDPTPTASAGSTQTVASGATVSLDGSGSWDPNSLPLQFAWIQTAGPLVSLANSSSEKPSFVAPAGPATLKFSLTVSNGNQTSSPSTVTINVNGTAPAFTSASSATFTTGVAKSFTVSTTGSPAAALAKTGSLPSGISFTDNGDGTATLSGTAAAAASPPGQSTNYPLTFNATSAAGNASQSFTLTVSNPGVAPAFTSANASTFTTGVAKSFTVSTTGSPAAALAKTGTLPSGITYKDNGDGTATLAGTAAAVASPPGQSTNYPLTFNATSAAGNASQSFTLTVTNPGTAPAFTSANASTFTTGVAKSFTVSTTGSPAAALAKTGSLPSGISFTDNGDGTATLSGTAAAAASPPGQSTNYPLTFNATSAAGNASQSFTLTVSNPGVAPAFTSASSATFTTGVAKSFTVSTTGSPAAALAKTGTLPSGISFTDNGDGTATLAGTAATAASPPGQSANYPLTFNATSAAGNASQSFTLTVSNPGVAPAFTSANASTFTTGVAKSFTVSTTGSPAAALAKTGTLPSGITYKDNGDGTATLAGTAAAVASPPGQSTNYPLTFNATSAAGNASQSFTLTVTNPGTAPAFTSASSATFTTGVAKSFTVSTTGSPAAALAKTGTLPSGISYKDNGDGTATLAGTAAAVASPPGQSTNYPLTFNATSAAGNASQSFTLTVTNPGTAPAYTSASSAPFTTGVAKSFTVSTTGSPAAALAKTGTLPSGISYKDNGDGTATLAGTAAAVASPPGQSTNYPLTFNATSAAGNASQSFTLTVTNPEHPVITPPAPEDPAAEGRSTPPAGNSSPGLASESSVRLSKDRVQLSIGKSSRRVVKVLPAPTSQVECQGSLPRGARCRVTVHQNVVVESSRAVKGLGTYRLTVHVVGQMEAVRLPLIVLVQRPGDLARNSRAVAE